MILLMKDLRAGEQGRQSIRWKAVAGECGLFGTDDCPASGAQAQACLRFTSLDMCLLVIALHVAFTVKLRVCTIEWVLQATDRMIHLAFET